MWGYCLYFPTHLVAYKQYTEHFYTLQWFNRPNDMVTMFIFLDLIHEFWNIEHSMSFITSGNCVRKRFLWKCRESEVRWRQWPVLRHHDQSTSQGTSVQWCYKQYTDYFYTQQWFNRPNDMVTMFIFLYLIPEANPSQKCQINTNPILNGYG
jgi:hypothetical protein